MDAHNSIPKKKDVSGGYTGEKERGVRDGCLLLGNFGRRSERELLVYFWVTGPV